MFPGLTSTMRGLSSSLMLVVPPFRLPLRGRWSENFSSLASIQSHPRELIATPGHHRAMRTVFEVAGGNGGLRRLAEAWHRRVMVQAIT